MGVLPKASASEAVIYVQEDRSKWLSLNLMPICLNEQKFE